MADSNDNELLREYVDRNSESAFAGLVQRHLNLVYSVALRQVENAGHAEEITQAVFIILARKARGLRANTILEGWLYETTRLTALSFLRSERRRRFREHEAYMQSNLQDTDNPVWDQLAPLLDEAMSRLGQKDRDAVILRFFKEKSIRDVAATMQVSEAAAQRRVLRAMEKLRECFARRCVTSNAATIAKLISAHSIQAAPAGFAKVVSAVAMTKGATASTSTLTLIKGALKVMAWTKMKTVAVVGVAAILVTGTTSLVIKHEHQRQPAGPLPEASWAFKGYATPEASFQSACWAMSKGDMKAVAASYTPAFQASFMETAGKGKTDAELSAMFVQIAGMIADFQVIRDEPISSDEAILHFRASRMGYEKVPLKKIAGEWKLNGNIAPDGPG